MEINAKLLTLLLNLLNKTVNIFKSACNERTTTTTKKTQHGGVFHFSNNNKHTEKLVEYETNRTSN